jgi:hypothetical protein
VAAAAATAAALAICRVTRVIYSRDTRWFVLSTVSVCSWVVSVHALSSLIWQHVWLKIFNLIMDCVRTHGSVDKTRVASEICCHLRAICGIAAPGYRTAFRRTFAFKRRNEGAKNELKRRRGQWSHGGYPDGVAAREDKSIVYRGILTLRPKIQHRCISKWGSENFGVSWECQGPCTIRQKVETCASFSYHDRVVGLGLFPIWQDAGPTEKPPILK